MFLQCSINAPPFWMICLAFTKRNLSHSLLSPISLSSLAFLAAFLQWVSSVCSSKNQCLSKVQLLFRVGKKTRGRKKCPKKRKQNMILALVSESPFSSLLLLSRNLRECTANNWTMRTVLFALSFSATFFPSRSGLFHFFHSFHCFSSVLSARFMIVLSFQRNSCPKSEYFVILLTLMPFQTCMTTSVQHKIIKFFKMLWCMERKYKREWHCQG